MREDTVFWLCAACVPRKLRTEPFSQRKGEKTDLPTFQTLHHVSLSHFSIGLDGLLFCFVLFVWEVFFWLVCLCFCVSSRPFHS